MPNGQRVDGNPQEKNSKNNSKRNDLTNRKRIIITNYKETTIDIILINRLNKFYYL